MSRGVFVFLALIVLRSSACADTIVSDSNLIYSSWVASHQFIKSQMPDSSFICWSTLGSPYCDYTGNNPSGRGGFALWSAGNGKYLARGYALKDNTVNGYWAYWCWMSYGAAWTLDSLIGAQAGSWFAGYRDVCDCNPDRGFVSDTSKTALVPGWYISIQAAINCATNGDTVLVAPGTYSGLGNNNISFLGKAICVKSERGAKSTVIDLKGAKGFALVNFESTTSVLDGFTVENGNNGDRGGAVRCEFSSPTIKNCIFRNNTGPNYAGAVYFADGSPQISNCLFIGNTAIHGGAISAGRSSATLSGCAFLRNTASQWGGAMFMQDNVSLAFDNCTFSHNSSLVGIGGTLFIQERYAGPSQPVFNNCIISFSRQGGAMYIDRATPVLSCSDIFGNSGGDWTGYISVQLGTRGNFAGDPMYCDTAKDSFSVSQDSPCASANNSCGQLVGAYGVECLGSLAVVACIIEGETLTNNRSHTPKFVWSYFSPATVPQTRFEIAVGIDNDWTYSEMWNPAPFNSPDTFVTYAGGLLVDGQTYYLRLRISDGSSWSNWYYTSFRMNTPPAAPVPSWPTMATTVTNAPTLSVENAFDAEADTLKYDFEIFYDSMLTNLAESAMNVPETYNPDTTYWTVSPPLDDNKFYYWRARAFDGYEYSAWSGMRMFIANSVNEPPTVPVLLSPPDSTGNIVYTRKPQLNWVQSTDPDPMDWTRYRVELSLNPQFTLVIQLDSLWGNWTFPPDSLDYGTHWWWRVTAFDRFGAAVPGNVTKDFWIWQLGDVDHSHSTDIADLSRLIDFLYISFAPITPLKVADVDGDCAVDISDLSRMIDYLYITFTPLDDGCWP